MKTHANRAHRKTPRAPLLSIAPGQLVDGTTLLQILFPPECRPTLRWLRDRQATRTLPFVKIGHLVFFNPDKVREHLELQNA